MNIKDLIDKYENKLIQIKTVNELKLLFDVLCEIIKDLNEHTLIEEMLYSAKKAEEYEENKYKIFPKCIETHLNNLGLKKLKHELKLGPPVYVNKNYKAMIEENKRGYVTNVIDNTIYLYNGNISFNVNKDYYNSIHTIHYKNKKVWDRYEEQLKIKRHGINTKN